MAQEYCFYVSLLLLFCFYRLEGERLPSLIPLINSQQVLQMGTEDQIISDKAL
ncbi:hypothetical protein JCM10914_2249 [Paenibacillus sp. JCM 10914]|nr:hypothetical protein JCM10914_2249 [Paenibacillus sp. JCM 10914]